MKMAAIVFALIFSQLTYAKTMCVCQTGSEPLNQVKAFKAGCAVWLAARSCDERKIVSVSADLEKTIPEAFNDGTIKLGYVGHWSSSSETKDFLNKSIVPLAEKRNLDFIIDNTACDGMSNAFEVQDYLIDLKNKGFKNKIEFKGNQVVSLGIWNNLLGNTFNLFAGASTDSVKTKFPVCSSFLNQKCSRLFQENNSGLCVNESHELELLTCQMNTREIVENNSEIGETTRTSKRFEWVKSDVDAGLYYVQAFNDKSEKVNADDAAATRFTIMQKRRPDVSFYSATRASAIDEVNYLNRSVENTKKRMAEWNKL